MGGHRVPFSVQIAALTTGRIWDPCHLGLPELLTVVHVTASCDLGAETSFNPSNLPINHFNSHYSES